MNTEKKSAEGNYCATMSEEEYLEGVESNLGICTDCGETADDFYEPDRVGGKCPSCGSMRCVGFEWALISGNIEFAD